MVLVVAGHSIRGLAAAKIGSREVVGVIDTFLYLGRLPVFALAVGLLTPAAVERAGAKRFLQRRMSLLLYLYLVWTLIQGTAEVLTTPWKNHPVDWFDVLAIWKPIGQMWFMPHLMVATLVLVAVAPWRGGRRAVIGTILVVIVSLAAWGTDPEYFGTGGIALLVWYVLGAAIGVKWFREVSARIPTPVLVIGGAIGVVGSVVMVVHLPVAAPTIGYVSRSLEATIWGVVAAVIEVAGAFALTTAWARYPRTSAWMAYIGRHSLSVYLAHIMVTAGVRIVLVRLGVTDLWLHMGIAVPLAVLFPLILERVTRPFPYLFVPPWRVKKRPARAAAAA